MNTESKVVVAVAVAIVVLAAWGTSVTGPTDCGTYSVLQYDRGKVPARCAKYLDGPYQLTR